MALEYGPWQTRGDRGGYWFREVRGRLGLTCSVIRQSSMPSRQPVYRYEVKMPGKCEDGSPGIRTVSWGTVASAPRARRIVDAIIDKHSNLLELST